ncbi:MAG: RNA polymerase factor sigma-54 [Angelakisella sp.]
MSSFHLGTSQKLTQSISLSQRQQYSLKLLSMPANELRELVARELECNPTIEYDDSFYDGEASSRVGGESGDGDGEHTLEPYEGNRTATNQTLREELRFQLVTGNFDLYLPLGEYIIACLDDNGYLKMTAESIAIATGRTTEQVEKALEILQQFEPTGVFARNLRECLLLQLRAISPRQPLAERIVSEFLEQVAQNRPDTIAKETETTLGQVKDAIVTIKSLNPKPGSGYYCERAAYVVPDIKVTAEGDSLRVSMIKGVSVHINPYYTDRLALVDPMTRDYLRDEIGKGRGLISCLEQRQKTLSAIALKAVERQRDFFLRGAPLLPLTMGEIATDIGIHESTVSRAVSGKYIRYAKGTMPLGELFCGKLESGSSSSFAKGRLREIVEGEDKNHPLSDAAITELLSEKGICISRRCVAKYREELEIPTSQQRKKW